MLNTFVGGIWEVGPLPGKAVPTPDRTRLRPFEHTIANTERHELVVTMTGECFDVCGRERVYVCRHATDDDAIARWHGWLRSMGEEDH